MFEYNWLAQARREYPRPPATPPSYGDFQNLRSVVGALLNHLEQKEKYMSTNDVPGANARNKDVLAMGCWSEHQDGSLILVESVEGGTVVYSMFDMDQDPPVEYRDAMPEAGFKKQFTWDPGNKGSEKWTWHDKTPFDWGLVMEDFPPGPKQPSAQGVLSAAARVAKSLNLRAQALSRGGKQRKASEVVEILKEAIAALEE